MKMPVVVAVATAFTALLSGCSTENSAGTAEPTAAAAATASPGSSTPTTSKSAKPVDSTKYRQDDDGFGRAGYFFSSPSGSFSCAIFDTPLDTFGLPIGAACQGRAATPPGEQDCVKPDGLQAPVPGLGVGPSGTQFLCIAGSPLFTSESTVLPYRSSLIANGYTCHSEETGVTCQYNLHADGFRVSREASSLTLDGGSQQPDASVTVPDVRGERPTKAENLLAEAGLTARVVGGTGRGPGGGQCVVAEQEPAAGAKVAAGTRITMTTGEVGGKPGSC